MKIYPNLTMSQPKNRILHKTPINRLLVPLTTLKRSMYQKSSLDMDRSISQLTFTLDCTHQKIGIERNHKLKYLQTAILSCQYDD